MTFEGTQLQGSVKIMEKLNVSVKTVCMWFILSHLFKRYKQQLNNLRFRACPFKKLIE